MHVRFDDCDVPVAAGQTVLQALLAAGRKIPFGCRSGACQTCLLRASAGPIPGAAQAGLRPALRLTGHLLACQCVPEAPLTLHLPASAGLRWQARVASIAAVAPGVRRVLLEPPAGFTYTAGQFVTLWRDASTGRAYSLASLPDEDRLLELHVRVLHEGEISRWISEALEPGDSVELRGPAGDCVYVPDSPDGALLLAATGVGIAPLWGVLRDALRHGHRGPIHVVHAAGRSEDLYLFRELEQIASVHPQLRYHGTAGRDGAEVALALAADFTGWRAFLCGAPAFVARLRRGLFLAGAASANIRSDAFLPARSPASA